MVLNVYCIIQQEGRKRPEELCQTKAAIRLWRLCRGVGSADGGGDPCGRPRPCSRRSYLGDTLTSLPGGRPQGSPPHILIHPRPYGHWGLFKETYCCKGGNTPERTCTRSSTASSNCSELAKSLR